MKGIRDKRRELSAVQLWRLGVHKARMRRDKGEGELQSKVFEQVGEGAMRLFTVCLL